EARLEVVAPGHAGQGLALRVTSGDEIAIDGEIPRSIQVDTSGRGSLALRLRALREGASTLAVRAGEAGSRDLGASDHVESRIEIAPSAVSQPVALRAVVGPGAS